MREAACRIGAVGPQGSDGGVRRPPVAPIGLVTGRRWRSMKARCRIVGSCWLWSGKVNNSGYGVVMISGRRRLAHRVSWAYNFGDTKRLVLHKCHTRRCINPAHLYAGTDADNVRDMCEAGRWRSALGQRSHCKHGHPFSGSNLGWRICYGRLTRKCNQCEEDNNRRRRARGCGKANAH